MLLTIQERVVLDARNGQEGKSDEGNNVGDGQEPSQLEAKAQASGQRPLDPPMTMSTVPSSRSGYDDQINAPPAEEDEVMQAFHKTLSGQWWTRWKASSLAPSGTEADTESDSEEEQAGSRKRRRRMSKAGKQKEKKKRLELVRCCQLLQLERLVKQTEVKPWEKWGYDDLDDKQVAAGESGYMRVIAIMMPWRVQIPALTLS
ncbi:hypothetical protein FN846DRAFT_903781 [Sphaerosporella brunnea]|uniref:Uncharacterized protein n=1 Tax=Sphaerosporella brunnea TaxID=1250544 RepID=A0A5J5F652_9PEZI|nr:hypothetical protein FN846DRAFT_903781 [Sphaerosporella brunnea]